jgi:hypothetical protein
MGRKANVDIEKESLIEALPCKYLKDCFVDGSA